MQSVTYLLTPNTGHYGRVGRCFREAGIWVVAVHRVDVLSDGSVVIQFDVADRPERLRTVFDAERAWIRGYQLAPGPDHTRLQLHFEPAGVHRDLIELHRTYATVFEYPIEVVDHATQTFRVTEVGQESELRQLVAETRETIDVTIEQVGAYEPVASGAVDELTGQQRAVLQTAVELGYYDVPRNVTYADIAERLECSASAVGQHLRRAEETVMPRAIRTEHRPAVE